MRLYSGKFNLIGEEIVQALIDASLVDIERGQRSEAELDVVGVLREYQRMDRDLTQRSRDAAAVDGSNAMQAKRRLAKEAGFRVGDDAMDYLVNQIIETFVHSAHIEEIYGEDRELRAVITPILRKHTQDRDDELDVEVRSKIRNLQEGSTAWDIEYEKALQRIKERKGLQ